MMRQCDSSNLCVSAAETVMLRMKGGDEEEERPGRGQLVNMSLLVLEQ